MDYVRADLTLLLISDTESSEKYSKFGDFFCRFENICNANIIELFVKETLTMFGIYVPKARKSGINLYFLSSFCELLQSLIFLTVQ